MTGPRTEQEWRWAEARAFEQLWGADAALRLTERIGVLTLMGDQAGVARIKEIAQCFDQMLSARADREQ